VTTGKSPHPKGNFQFEIITCRRRGMEMRDDFPKAVIETLARRVGVRCSNVKCRKLTIGPHSDESRSVNVGVAAHITAASAGGPRFDPTMTAEDRQSIENGIWLCQVCAKLIDNDEERFTVTVLRDWKKTAEYLANTEVSTGSRGPQMLPAEAGSAIRFVADDWEMWRERGNLPGDSLVFISGWARGDLRYACNLRLRNDGEDEIQLKRLRIEFQADDGAVIDSDHFAIQLDQVVLPPRKWVTIPVNHGLHDQSIFNTASSVWLSAQKIGDNHPHRWKIAEYDPALVAPPES
jgi:hypothetical protein